MREPSPPDARTMTKMQWVLALALLASTGAIGYGFGMIHGNPEYKRSQAMKHRRQQAAEMMRGIFEHYDFRSPYRCTFTPGNTNNIEHQRDTFSCNQVSEEDPATVERRRLPDGDSCFPGPCHDEVLVREAYAKGLTILVIDRYNTNYITSNDSFIIGEELALRVNSHSPAIPMKIIFGNGQVEPFTSKEVR